MHIEKTGGTSLEEVLRNQFPEKEIFGTYGAKDWNAITASEQLSGHSLFIGHSTFDVFEYLPPDTFSVTILRDPIDHCISVYNHVRFRRENDRFEEFERTGMTFERYICEVLPNDLGLARHAQTSRLVGRKVWRQLKRSMSHPQELDHSMREIAIQNLAKFHLVGFTETIQDTYNRLCMARDWRAGKVSAVNATASEMPGTKRLVLRRQLSTDILNELRRITVVEQAVYEYAKTLPNAVP